MGVPYFSAIFVSFHDPGQNLQSRFVKKVDESKIFLVESFFAFEFFELTKIHRFCGRFSMITPLKSRVSLVSALRTVFPYVCGSVFAVQTDFPCFFIHLSPPQPFNFPPASRGEQPEMHSRQWQTQRSRRGRSRLRTSHVLRDARQLGLQRGLWKGGPSVESSLI